MDDFIQEFKQVKAQSYLKIYLREMRQSHSSNAKQIESKSVTAGILKVAMRVCRTTVRSIDDMIDDKKGYD